MDIWFDAERSLEFLWKELIIDMFMQLKEFTIDKEYCKLLFVVKTKNTRILDDCFVYRVSFVHS